MNLNSKYFDRIRINPDTTIASGVNVPGVDDDSLMLESGRWFFSELAVDVTFSRQVSELVKSPTP